MSVKGMMQTVFVTELKALQPEISDATIRYILDSIVEFQADAGRAGFIACAEIMNDACTSMDDVWSSHQIDDAANQYAQRVKAGE